MIGWWNLDSLSLKMDHPIWYLPECLFSGPLYFIWHTNVRFSWAHPCSFGSYSTLCKNTWHKLCITSFHVYQYHISSNFFFFFHIFTCNQEKVYRYVVNFTSFPSFDPLLRGTSKFYVVIFLQIPIISWIKFKWIIKILLFSYPLYFVWNSSFSKDKYEYVHIRCPSVV